jgi:indolepyruvate ferredoxin oxidoreductase, beta subunit
VVVLEQDEVPVNQGRLRPGGVLIDPTSLGGAKLPHPRSMNVALLGCLSRHLEIAEEAWRDALRRNLPAKVLEANRAAFALGLSAVARRSGIPA